MSVFAWCSEGRHDNCLRTYESTGGVRKGQQVYCQCDAARCDCSKNPRKEGVQVEQDVV